MASLLDIVTQNIQQMEKPELDQTSRARNLFAARSGKAVTAPSIAQSNVAERVAAAGTQAQLGQVQQQAGLLTAQLGQRQQEQQQQFQAAQQGAQLEQQGLAQTGNLQRNQILAQSTEGRKQLQQQQQGAQLEQQAFQLALQDRQYLDELKINGERRRLNNTIRFKEDLARDAAQESQSLLRGSISFNSLLDANDRDFQRATMSMNISDILAGLRQEARDARNLGTLNAAGGLLNVGVGAAATSLANKPATSTTTNVDVQGGYQMGDMVAK